jgi:SAM-dependent methyltransferase
MGHILEVASLYNAFQKAGGFLSGRLKAFDQYVDLRPVKRVFDIGCGPGHTVKYLPAGIDYVGFDTDERYIRYAKSRFGDKGRFLKRHFDASAAKEFGQPDLILMNGVLHHMDDTSVRAVVASAAAVLPGHGVFFCIEPCFEKGQNPISHFLLRHDRGQYVRTEPQYRELVATGFANTNVFVRHDLSWVPYTFAIVHASHTVRT